MHPFYQLANINGRILYVYPNGGSILSLPFVAALNDLGISAVRPDGTYSLLGEFIIQRFIASLLMALLAVVFFRTACLLLPMSWSLAMTIAAAFGTQIWSSATRALWSNTWEVFIAGWIVLVLLRAARYRRAPNAVMLATLAAWTYIVRPTGAILVAAVTIYVLIEYRRQFVAYAMAGAAWAIAFLLYSWSTFGQPIPGYYHQALFFNGNFFDALSANILSPSRGLLIFVPATAVVVFLIVRHWRELPYRSLAVLALGALGAEFMVVAFYNRWWGGWSYGPRLLTGLVPWLVLLAVIGCRAMLDYCERRGAAARTYRQVVVASSVALICLGIAINANGAFNWQTGVWNRRVHIDQTPSVVWNWRNPQFLAGL